MMMIAVLSLMILFMMRRSRLMMLMMIHQTAYNHLPQAQHTTDDGVGKGDDGYDDGGG